VARERLQILLEYERKLGSQIDLFNVLREEILAVVSRHVSDSEKVQVTVDRGAKFSTLGVNIEIPNSAERCFRRRAGMMTAEQEYVITPESSSANQSHSERSAFAHSCAAQKLSLGGVHGRCSAPSSTLPPISLSLWRG